MIHYVIILHCDYRVHRIYRNKKKYIKNRFHLLIRPENDEGVGGGERHPISIHSFMYRRSTSAPVVVKEEVDAAREKRGD